ncbi:hypothetical protein GE061_019467 [Apolygus lucorum]|uniref:Uncharacterized protein n=1 Tax=Apolygus lucorum TaxID=248454 RepID=A0A6A4JVM7_APOLU|nr:hypothetical protein GE061_019467 [Apolygus lucorum]
MSRWPPADPRGAWGLPPRHPGRPGPSPQYSPQHALSSSSHSSPIHATYHVSPIHYPHPSPYHFFISVIHTPSCGREVGRTRTSAPESGKVDSDAAISLENSGICDGRRIAKSG